MTSFVGEAWQNSVAEGSWKRKSDLRQWVLAIGPKLAAVPWSRQLNSWI